MFLKNSIYAKARNIVSIDQCFFYHTMDLPGYGTVNGEWDLRNREAIYLGNVDFRGKSVLDLGTASGHLCFFMEKQGADVTAYDVSNKYELDTVPYYKYAFNEHDFEKIMRRRKEIHDKLNNSFWFAHRAFKSRAKMVYGTVYQIPSNIGEFDICTFQCILQHLRDPFLALHQASKHIKTTAIITDVLPEPPFERSIAGKWMNFIPDASSYDNSNIHHTWWHLQPELVIEFLKILGFDHTELTHHTQLWRGQTERKLYTVVGKR